MLSLPFSDPIWDRPGRVVPMEVALDPKEEADVAIIGGGLQGLSIAFQAARRGLRVRVIEAGRIGGGASGLNGGQVIPGLKYDPEWLMRHFGDQRGAALVSFTASTADRVFELIEREHLHVDHWRGGWIQACHTDRALQAAEERNRQWKVQGADVMLLNASEIGLLTGASQYLGGWLDRRAGTVNPLALTLELARIAAESGARILEGQKATALRRVTGGWRVTLADGSTVLAKTAVVATNAYSDSLVPGLARSLVPLHSFQIATEPLSIDQQEQILPHGQAVSDSRRILVYYRKSPDGRLVFGGRGRMALPKSADDWRHLERAMVRVFPQLAGIGIDKRWFGRVAMTPDHLPHIHEPEKGLLMTAGCQGRGVALMTALGAPMADYIASGDKASLPFPVSDIRPIPLHALRQAGIAATIAWYRLLDGLER